MIRYILLLCLLASCAGKTESVKNNYTTVKIEPVYEDSVSIRAITMMGKNLGFAGTDNLYGLYDNSRNLVRTSKIEHDSLKLQFRAVAATSNDFFVLSIESPALLFKTGDQGKMELVYKEEGEGVFYDAMTFWDDLDGIAVGDPVGGCMSVIVTRDGGNTWAKVPCEKLPASDKEGAFAASNTNIAVNGDHAWIATGGVESRILHSADRGQTWESIEVPVVKGKETTGMYSVAFYDAMNGFAIGGDYTEPTGNTANKLKTTDGGKTWKTVADGIEPGYLSCVQYVPGGQASELVAVGFNGIYYSSTAGDSWIKLSDEGFYTLRFDTDSTAYAAGKDRISRLEFK
ncbi:WD40/YVTN/BNR-like repeat-containing protein [Robertkochia solimangrovi]|uniref:WD40/YVTN/BNR-like repeat-containing protein n=1 Tax=Robertkochia solimangrovi TaxID=2213046 RepID=UPI001181447F|nr:YCF48-related protein [Robertkochia solimangrovi]TRZ43688.1 oxidoreductase [Robertkochia solimangrovi]